MAKDDMNFAKQEEVSTEGFCFVTITRMAVVQGYVEKKIGAISCQASNYGDWQIYCAARMLLNMKQLPLPQTALHTQVRGGTDLQLLNLTIYKT